MITFIYVGLGGFLGSILRFSIGILLKQFPFFPFATLLVNIIGSLLIGFFAVANRTPTAFDFFFITGVLGGFTTFSAFSYETIQLIRSGQTITGISFILSNILFSFLAVILGIFIKRLF